MAQDISFSHKVIKGFLWVGSGTFLGQCISWVSTIIVIRLLLPSDYGLMAMAVTFISVLTIFSNLGVNAIIIQAEKINEKEIRQIFGFAIVCSFIFWLFAFLMAPVIAGFYNEKNLTLIIRVISVNFFIFPFYQIPQGLLLREMNFKASTKVNFLAQVGTSLLSVIMALQGFGVWTLVVALIANNVIKLVSFNLTHFTIKKPIFNFKGVEKYMKFGLIITGERLLYYLYTQVDNIIIGKFLGNNILGIYSVALNLASIPMEKVLPIVTQVSFTSYSRIQDDLERIKRNILRSIRAVAFLTFPIFFGMVGVAPEGIMLILGPRWEIIIIPFQLLCFILPLKAISPILPPAVFAINRPMVNLTNMAISCIVMAIAFLVGVQWGVIGVCFAWVIVYPFVFIVTIRRCFKVLRLQLKLFLSEVKVPFAGSILMLGCILIFKKSNLITDSLVFLAVAILFGIVFYASFFLLFRKEDFLEIKRLVRKR